MSGSVHVNDYAVLNRHIQATLEDFKRKIYSEAKLTSNIPSKETFTKYILILKTFESCVQCT